MHVVHTPLDSTQLSSMQSSMLSLWYGKASDSTASVNPLTKKNGEPRDFFVGWVVKKGHGSDSTGVNRICATGFSGEWPKADLSALRHFF